MQSGACKASPLSMKRKRRGERGGRPRDGNNNGMLKDALVGARQIALRTDGAERCLAPGIAPQAIDRRMDFSSKVGC